ncbi:unnamed protein product, partial [Pelagomonas calceolata]
QVDIHSFGGFRSGRRASSAEFAVYAQRYVRSVQVEQGVGGRRLALGRERGAQRRQPHRRWRRRLHRRRLGNGDAALGPRFWFLRRRGRHGRHGAERREAPPLRRLVVLRNGLVSSFRPQEIVDPFREAPPVPVHPYFTGRRQLVRRRVARQRVPLEETVLGVGVEGRSPPDGHGGCRLPRASAGCVSSDCQRPRAAGRRPSAASAVDGAPPARARPSNQLADALGFVAFAAGASAGAGSARSPPSGGVDSSRSVGVKTKAARALDWPSTQRLENDTDIIT